MLNDTQSIESYLPTNPLTKLLLDQSFDGEAKILMSFWCFESFNMEALLYFSRSG